MGIPERLPMKRLDDRMRTKTYSAVQAGQHDDGGDEDGSAGVLVPAS